MPDGRVARFEVPEGTTPEQAQAMMAQHFQQQPAPEPEKSFGDQLKQGAANIAGGLVRGAGSIGASILWPIDKATDLIKGDRNKTLTSLVTGDQKAPMSRNEERRQAMDEALTSLIGSDPNSLLYKGGKLTGEIAGTAGAGGAAANLLARVPGVAAAAPNLLKAIGTSGMSAGNAGLGTRMAGGAIAGGVSAGMVDPSSMKSGALIGGALPGVTKLAGAVGSRIGDAIRPAGVSPEVAALAKRAQELGIDVPADRIGNSKVMDAIASGLNYVPFSGRAATEARMGTQLNQALSKTFGENSPNVTQALRAAEGKLGGQFDDFLRGNTLKVDGQFANDLTEVANKASRELSNDGASIISKQIDDIISKAETGAIDGQAAYNIKKTLDRIGNRNSPEAWYALELKGKLMDALNRSVGSEKAGAFKELRQQYGNMLELQKLAKNGAEGEVSVARLANMKNIRNDRMQELADIAAQFVKPRESQHGAMQRAVVGLGAASTGGLPGLLGGATVGRATNGLLNSNLARGLVTGEISPTLGLLADPELVQMGYRTAPALLADR